MSPLTQPTIPELLSRAQKIAALAHEQAKETETARHVSEQMITRMREADLFRIMQPKAYGGFEYGFEVFMEVVAVLARGCCSTGWVYALLASHQWLIACYSKQAQDEVWQDNTALAAGTYAPVAQAVAVEGGYRVTGAGGFCSGCDNAQWLFLGGMIPDADGSSQPGLFLLRAPDLTINDDWFTMGLAGTGSKTIVAKDTFVPARRVVPFSELSGAAPPDMHATTRDTLYPRPFLVLLALTLVAPVLGAAENALDEFLAMASGRTTRGAVVGEKRRMAEFATVQMRVAEASALIDAARLLLFRDIADANDAVAHGKPTDIAALLRNRRDQAFCVRLLVQAVDLLFLAAGGQGLYLDHPLQRAWRDAHAATAHIGLNWDATATMYGKFLFDLKMAGRS